MELVLLALAVVYVVTTLYRAWRERREYIDGYSPLSYLQHSTAGADAWRWRLPVGGELNRLQVTDYPDRSELHLPWVMSLWQRVMAGLGLFGLAGVLWLALTADRSVPAWPVLLGFLALWPVALLFAGSRVRRLVLTPTHLIAVQNFGLFLHWRRRFRRSAITDFSGGVQSYLTGPADQLDPDFFIYIRGRRRIAGRWRRRIGTCLNPGEGHWVLGGLESWRSDSAAETAAVSPTVEVP